MKIEITEVSKNLAEIADHVGGIVGNNKITLPPEVGQGYFRQYHFSAYLKMVIINCSFREAFHFKRTPLSKKDKSVVFRFQHIFGRDNRNNSANPAVHVSSEDMQMDVVFPPEKPIQSLLVAIDVGYLKDMIQLNSDPGALKELLETDSPFLFDEIITPEIWSVVDEIENYAKKIETLDTLFHRIKAEELIYLFLTEFIKRKSVNMNPVNSADVQVIYEVRALLLQDLGKVPYIPGLAKLSGMSESKMRKLFRQIFGLSIYQYYQHFRMNKAASMVREQGFSVSEAGYRLGFSNLSHFTRLFERHMGIKPKKYAGKSGL